MYYCTTGIPDYLLDCSQCLRTEQYATCTEEFQSLVNNKEIKFHAMKLLGSASFQLYNKKRMSRAMLPSVASVCVKHAEKAVSYLGAAFDEKLFKDGDPEAEMLDIALIDVTFGRMEGSKVQVRCLLCRSRCKKGEKLISSHIWQNSILHDFVNSCQAPPSKKIFDVMSNTYGRLQSPRQISFPMLCKKCEDQFSQYEKEFKSKIFDHLHGNPEYVVNPKGTTVHLKKKTGRDNDREWLYHFCLSIIFRALGLAIDGSMKKCGNASEVYKLFSSCRKLLMEPSSLADVKMNKPRIAIFITPINMMIMNKTNIDPALASIIFSKGMCVTSDFSLSDGIELPKGKVEYILCSVGAINIIASVSSSDNLNIPSECLVTPSQCQFIIPQAFRRYLIFPKGLMKTFEDLAAKKAMRVLHAPHMTYQDGSHVWLTEELESYLSSDLEVLALQSSNSCQSRTSRTILLNLLPCPYSAVYMPVHVKDIALSSVAIHSTSIMDNGLRKSVLVLKESIIESEEDTVFAFINIDTDSHTLWTGYILSSIGGISIQEPLIKSKVDVRVFQKLEKVFDTRHVLDQQLHEAIKEAGFLNATDFALWLNYCW